VQPPPRLLGEIRRYPNHHQQANCHPEVSSQALVLCHRRVNASLGSIPRSSAGREFDRKGDTMSRHDPIHSSLGVKLPASMPARPLPSNTGTTRISREDTRLARRLPSPRTGVLGLGRNSSPCREAAGAQFCRYPTSKSRVIPARSPHQKKPYVTGSFVARSGQERTEGRAPLSAQGRNERRKSRGRSDQPVPPEVSATTRLAGSSPARDDSISL